MASYPTIVRRFQPHVDGSEFVRAAHMDDVQDEVTAVETTLGTRPHVNAASSGSPTAYPSVAARLDAIQAGDAAQQTQINGLLAASNTGWSLPLLSVLATGTVIAPTPDWLHVQPTDWHPLRWTRAMVDTESAFNAGPSLVIPKSGWWVMTSTLGMADPSDAVTIAHYLWARIRVTTSPSPTQTINIDLGQGDSSALGRAGGYHRITMAIAGDFYVGDTVQVQLRHVSRPTDPAQPNPPQIPLSASSRTQLTYIRGLPTTPRAAATQLPYEIGT